MPTREVILDVECADQATVGVVREWTADQDHGFLSGQLTATEQSIDELQAVDPMVVGLVISFAAGIADGTAKELGKQLVGGVADLLKSLYQRLFGPAADQRKATTSSVTVRLCLHRQNFIILTQRTTLEEIEIYAEVVIRESQR